MSKNKLRTQNGGDSPVPELEAHSKAYIVEEIELNSDTAKKIYRHHFVAFGDKINSISNITRIVGDPGDAKDAEKIIDDLFATYEEKLDKRLTMCEQVMSDARIKGHSKFTTPVSLEAKCLTSHHIRYLDLIKKVDKLCILLNTINIRGEIATDEVHKYQREWNNRLANLANRVRTLSNDLKHKYIARQKLAKSNDAANASSASDADESTVKTSEISKPLTTKEPAVA